jgi:hypothetical protein
MYRADWSLKPGGQAYRDLVLGKWRTQEHGATDASGSYQLRGFKGKYRIEVASGGQRKTLDATLGDAGTQLDVVM